MRKFIMFLLDWEKMYIVWLIFLIVGCLSASAVTHHTWLFVRGLCELIGCGVFIAAGVYWIWKKQWLNAVMFFIPICLYDVMLFIFQLI